MANYLVAKCGNTTSSYSLRNEIPINKPYLRVSNGYLPLTTDTKTGIQVKVNNNTYAIQESYSTTLSSTSAYTNYWIRTTMALSTSTINDMAQIVLNPYVYSSRTSRIYYQTTKQAMIAGRTTKSTIQSSSIATNYTYSNYYTFYQKGIQLYVNFNGKYLYFNDGNFYRYSTGQCNNNATISIDVTTTYHTSTNYYTDTYGPSQFGNTYKVYNGYLSFTHFECCSITLNQTSYASNESYKLAHTISTTTTISTSTQ